MTTKIYESGYKHVDAFQRLRAIDEWLDENHPELYGDGLPPVQRIIDTVITGLLALQHFTKDEDQTLYMLVSQIVHLYREVFPYRYEESGSDGS
jgi:hypothetical protein